MGTKDSVIVLGLLGQCPLAGIAWQLLHYLVGFQRLGFKVFYVEETGAPSYDPHTKNLAFDCSYSLHFINETLRPYGFAESWAYRDEMTNQWRGVSSARVRALFNRALCVVNLCGASHPETLTHRPKGTFVYLETDPVLYQARLAQGDEAALRFVGGHDAPVMYGENLGAADCSIPLTHFDWKKIRFPVVMDLWLMSLSDSCYLAAGKPVVTQETGFNKYIPTGNGLFGFSSAEKAIAAFDSINGNYLFHAQAARDIAMEYFAAEKLLSKLLADVGLG